MSPRIAAPFALAILIAGCRNGELAREPQHGGTIVIATTADPDALFPPAALNMAARQATELIFEYLADVGPAMNTVGDKGFVKELASSWSWNADSSAITFRLNDKAIWQDGNPLHHATSRSPFAYIPILCWRLTVCPRLPTSTP